VPDLAHAVTWLPALVFLWMMVGAGLVFAPNAGRRDPRGLGIAVSMWGTLGAQRVAITPPHGIQVTGAAGLLFSLALYQWAAISIRGRLFSYAANDDLPQFVHRSGPYVFVRNPFYLSYLLAEIATVVLWPSVPGVVVVVFAAGYFQWLARFEEEKFARSPVATEYAEYKMHTGRLLPRWRLRASLHRR
jgi:protein-S-isoprenylcysteine O-methyltransferase Ste14